MQKSKKGGNFTSELSKLSVPFGLVLAQKSLESYLDKKKKNIEPKKNSTPKKTTTPKKTPKSSKQQVASTNLRKKALVAI